jgi:uncharacterized protein
MASKINFQLVNRWGYPVNIDFFPVQSSAKDLPLLIFCHGFKGFKDWGGFPYMMNKISGSGISAVSFNFSLNGVSIKNPSEFTRLDLFAQNTFSQELEDLGFIIEHFYNNSKEFNINKNKIAVAGHSRGGGIAILKANEDKRIKCLITLASVSDFNRYSEEHKKRWRKRGYFEVINTRPNQLMRINSTLLDDLEKNISRLDIPAAIKYLRIPILIIHGKEDLSVKFEEGEILYKNSNKATTEFFPVKNTGHTFGIVHPFKGSTKAFESVIEKMIMFLKKNL